MRSGMECTCCLTKYQRFSHLIPSNLNFLEIIVVGNRECTREEARYKQRRKRIMVEAKKKKNNKRRQQVKRVNRDKQR